MRILQTEIPPGFIDLGNGNPDPGLLPMKIIERAAGRYFTDADPDTLQYGAEAGNGDFLAALAEFLSSIYGSKVDPCSLFTSTGASSALDLLCTLYTQPGDLIFVEEPSYFLALRIFKDHGLRVLSIPLDNDGLRIDILEELLEQYQPKFIYTIPTFHNPANLTLSKSRREKLVQLAQEHDFIVIADEVYQFLAYTQEPPEPIALFTRSIPQVISINSFSKILAPGLRLGWIQAHDSVIDDLSKCGLLDSGGGMNPFTSAIVRHLIESGDLTDNLHSLRAAYLERMQAMTAALDHYLPDAEYHKPQGGFFVWGKVPGRDTTILRNKARSLKIDFRPGILFSSQAGMTDHLRLAYCYYDPDDIEMGIQKLADCLKP
ncbi:MAG: aminotransferase class I/II-fold pyridoxal phosphate-dependent enzyme [candidate division Zixibacteria bacterium]|nr:PLP-dependent aminotransferase family protein [candidate division Zixibacteria bacterium]NIR64664.1 PLP-dependent aminotransferase family protein [candidate division Zixibacteria bacterium]NIS46522.1 PLP-dependent aminotransferase family protein [candidate division Zixibacteria bacterium]NIU14639.1 PLP-dependent aminotransferase family protein [candidate division Zixibacteria bacterium]NIV06635.1 aminotransferase class I/II-fold pyridoxal phosphate-dependent enzyme [candidate division Zixiba